LVYGSFVFGWLGEELVDGVIEEGFKLFGVVERGAGFRTFGIPGGGLVKIESCDEGRATLFLLDDGAADVAVFIDQDDGPIIVPFTGGFIRVGVCLELVFNELK
jgi:hypothetical protein